MAPQPPRQIPGYYYDADKGKYFKIERAGTAPTSAAWSADNVKRRRLEDKAAAAHEHQVQRNKDRVRRATVLGHPLTGGFLARELGTVRLDVVPAGFAMGLVGKGGLPLADARWSGGGSAGVRRNVQHMYVDGQDVKTGVCVAFSTIDGDSLVSTYVPRDRNGRVHRRLLAEYHHPSTHVAPYQEITVSQISDIKCHQASNQILITCRSPGPDVSMWAFSPKVTAPDDPRPNWLLSWNGSSVYKCIRTPGRGGSPSSYQANTVAPAPSGSSNLLGLIGTNSGVVQWQGGGSGATSWWTPPTLPRSSDGGSGSGNSPTVADNPFRDIFAIDFQRDQPQVALFGGRPGVLWVGDTRAPAGTWSSVAVPSSITHLRSVGPGGHQVLVAGLRDTLALYDLRFRKAEKCQQQEGLRTQRFDNTRSRHRGGRGAGGYRGDRHRSHGSGSGIGGGHLRNADRPVLRFREYRNAAHVDIGFDYDADSGVVAAAHDDGKVALYSVKTGHRLLSPTPALSAAAATSYTASSTSIMSSLSLSSSTAPFSSSSSRPAAPGGGGASSTRGPGPTIPGHSGISDISSERGPIQSIQWQRFPRDHVPSLFVGVQSSINVYSFGVHDFDDEG
ncbi:hypothetical protein Micbo1qcDRAFT_229762 [Microdochium bolleyi]|uniref:WD40-repeat-containing domain protein n=1 Tax=Microdochium bolleyi TaxID=196109 RepID=A0A136JIK2_9PEZI|nr:hypothetical protein Micbo1qcDRAFT_229762 [Microdochium bolleyi]